jgi:decaprenylphospho-beta-D-ribofuranose 2-oxidase
MSWLVLRLNDNADWKMHVADFNYIGLHDRFVNWKALYGRTGFLEYHFVVPDTCLRDAFSTLVQMAEAQRVTLHLGILKRLGPAPREGLLSFPREGYTVNFQVRDCEWNRRLLVSFTDFLIELRGRVYLAKDACLLPRQLWRMYHRLKEWQEIARRYDPGGKIQSDLSLRLGIKEW